MHTPLPWSLQENYQGPLTDKFKNFPFSVVGPMFTPCLVYGDGKLNAGTARANGELIVRAVNNHEALVAMLAEVTDRFGHNDAPEDLECLDRARRTLANATQP